jgi:TolA-binding protein
VWRSKLAGWIDDHAVLMSEIEQRVAFKLAWNAATQLEGLPDFALTLDETRALYTFYLQHPHAPDPVRAQLDAHRKSAKGAKECAMLDAGERLAAESWRLEKIEKLEKLDPEYPAAYARGVELYRMERYGEAARAFETWLDAHPDGPFTLRARGHLRAAIRAKQEAP